MAGRAGGGGRPLRLPLNSLMAMDVVQRGVGGCIFCHSNGNVSRPPGPKGWAPQQWTIAIAILAMFSLQ
jgi:hypothetical protein